MDRVSHREYLTYEAYYDSQWNEPSSTDHYLMQVCQYLNRGRDGKLPDLEAFKLSFGRTDPQEKASAKEMEIANVSAIGRARWKARIAASQERGQHGQLRSPRDT